MVPAQITEFVCGTGHLLGCLVVFQTLVVSFAGGSWLRSVLGTMGKKEDVQDDASKRTVFGAAHSHFEQPSTAAELTAPAEDEPPAAAEMPLEHSTSQG